MTDAGAGLRMRDVVERTGVGEATLRAWERRYDFPAPARLPSGHRRYSERDVELVRQVIRLRDTGLAVHAAIEQARGGGRGPRSVFARLRRLRPELEVSVLPKPCLVALSHAIEDESSSGGGELVLIGAFQRELHYRQAEPRWREIARSAELAFVFADFARVRRPRGAPVEVPIPERDPLMSEWVLVCDGDAGAACLVAWERPQQQPPPDVERQFEMIWTADRDTARTAARICCELAGDDAPDEVRRASELLSAPAPRSVDELRRAEALTGRMVNYLARVT